MQTVSRIPDVPNDSFFAMNRWFYKLYQANLLFHVDDSPDSIVDELGGQVFTAEECECLDAAVDRMFAVHGDLVYEVGLKYFRKALPLPSE